LPFTKDYSPIKIRSEKPEKQAGKLAECASNNVSKLIFHIPNQHRVKAAGVILEAHARYKTPENVWLILVNNRQ